MNKIEKIVVGVSSLLMSIVLIRFSISKLAGWEVSVNAFIEMAKPLSINPTFFRLITGVQISILCLSYMATALYTLFMGKKYFFSPLSYYKLSVFANTFGFITMVGALLAEFFLRIQPKWPLVYIAIGIIFFSILNAYIINRKANQSIVVTQ
ncbi:MULTISPECIES: hypothetical protein [unclassified Saccharicrinis]|uniref:hypothetical protein n=1 Tax=unclassified Saccharicrinis TaxID=2646859 RepID=UPI003D33A601